MLSNKSLKQQLARKPKAPPCPKCKRPMTLKVERDRGTCCECR